MSDTDTPTESAPADAPEAHPAAETFSKEYVQELRNEAAKYRTQKNEAVEAAKSAVTQQFQGQLVEKDVTITELQNDLGAAQLELEKIRTAIEVLGASRIGHGTTLLDDPAVLEVVLQRSITVEACLSSNWHVGALPHWSAHPLPRWLDLGVRATVCTDNTLLSAVDASEEWRRAASVLTPVQLEQARAHGHAGAFRRA